MIPEDSGPVPRPEVDAVRDEAAEWHRVAEERRRQLERLQDQTLYRVAAAALARGRRLTRAGQRSVEPARRLVARMGRSAVAMPSRLRAPGREAELRSDVAALPPAPEGAARRGEVTAVIVTAAQPRRLDALLEALGRIGVASVVVDNAGVVDNASIVARHPGARRIPLTVPVSYAQANELAIREVTTPWVLLLNDDVAPLDDHWLDRMLVAADAGTVAVGAQLVHGRRGLLGGEGVDGLVQHAGIGLTLDGPLVRPLHLGRGDRPDVRDLHHAVPAATAACLLVRTDVHRQVGGLHVGFDYGSEDVDLCLRLGEHGRIRVALGSVLNHEEGATRLIDRRGGDRHERARRQSANRALLDARHAPSLRRRVVTEALAPRGADGTAGPLAATAMAADAVSLAIGVIGAPPSALLRALRDDPAVRIDTRGSGAVMVVTDPRRVPERDDPAADVPILAWIDAGDRVADWSRGALARVDAVLVIAGTTGATDAAGAGDVDAAIAGVETRLRELDPTMPVHRAAGTEDVRTAVRTLLLAPRWTVRIGAPGGRAAERWGDVPVAEALGRELRAHGVVVRTVGRDRWGRGADRTADVTVHLKGRGVAPVSDVQCNVVWVMSHPSEVAPGELEAADLVLAGSELLAARYRERTTTRVVVMPQAADARRFTPGPVEPDRASRVLFVGNTRSVPRPSVLGAIDAGLPLTLIGGGWERYVDPALVRHPAVANAQLPGWYRSADVVLNDHWEDMARWGLVSNRVFDVLACGTCVVSDDVPGMDALLDDAVVTFADRSDVGRTVRTLLADPAERAARAERGRRAVLAAHTWEHRAAALVALVAEHGGVTA
jgi:GT2 family glycosyltransferase/glycosyltransferase involved in cell wall biosynthesis